MVVTVTNTSGTSSSVIEASNYTISRYSNDGTKAALVWNTAEDINANPGDILFQGTIADWLVYSGNNPSDWSAAPGI